MSFFDIDKESPERIWKMMRHLNLLILLYITVISYHAIMGMASSNSAARFLRTIPVLPMEGNRFVAVVFILYSALLVLFGMDVEDNSINYVKAALELIISVMLTFVCGMAYSGIIILVMTDIIHSGYTRQKMIMALIPVIIVYTIVDSGILNLWLPNVSFSDYLVFYSAGAASVLQSILNTAKLVNIVMFIVFLVVTLRYQMDETVRIMRLNEELTEANIMLEEFSRKSAEMAQMKERNRLAREIHDTIGHVLTGIVTGLEACLLICDDNPELVRKQITTIQEVARQGMTDVRRSVRALRPDTLEKLSLSAAIERMIDEMCRSTGILFEYRCDDPLRDLAKDEEDVVYRVMQEGITNSVRHGEPDKISICIERSERMLHIRIEDNGKGCDEIREGFGLIHMRERLYMLGGSLTVNGSDGFTLTAHIPLR